MMLYRNIKAKAHSPDGDTEFFDIVTGVLQSANGSISTIFVHNLPRVYTSNNKQHPSYVL